MGHPIRSTRRVRSKIGPPGEASPRVQISADAATAAQTVTTATITTITTISAATATAAAAAAAAAAAPAAARMHACTALRPSGLACARLEDRSRRDCCPMTPASFDSSWLSHKALPEAVTRVGVSPRNSVLLNRDSRLMKGERTGTKACIASPDTTAPSARAPPPRAARKRPRAHASHRHHHQPRSVHGCPRDPTTSPRSSRSPPVAAAPCPPGGRRPNVRPAERAGTGPRPASGTAGAQQGREACSRRKGDGRTVEVRCAGGHGGGERSAGRSAHA